MSKYHKTPETSPLLVRLGQQKFNFGKHKGKTYEDVYDEDKAYVAWVLSKKTHDAAKYMKSAISYYELKVKEEFPDDDTE